MSNTRAVAELGPFEYVDDGVDLVPGPATKGTYVVKVYADRSVRRFYANGGKPYRARKHLPDSEYARKFLREHPELEVLVR